MTERADRWAKASFRVWSSEMSADEISATLGLTPTVTHLKGDLYTRRSTAVRKHHVFCLKSPLPTEAPLEKHLAWLCDQLEPVASRIDLIRDRCDLDLFCGFGSECGQGGFTLAPALLGRLAALGVRVVLDLYPTNPT